MLVKVYRYKVYDINKDGYVNSAYYGTSNAIKLANGVKINGELKLVDDTLLNGNGLILLSEG